MSENDYDDGMYFVGALAEVGLLGASFYSFWRVFESYLNRETTDPLWNVILAGSSIATWRLAVELDKYKKLEKR